VLRLRGILKAEVGSLYRHSRIFPLSGDKVTLLPLKKKEQLSVLAAESEFSIGAF